MHVIRKGGTEDALELAECLGSVHAALGPVHAAPGPIDHCTKEEEDPRKGQVLTGFPDFGFFKLRDSAAAFLGNPTGVCAVESVLQPARMCMQARLIRR